jgi:hypothetical protein
MVCTNVYVWSNCYALYQLATVTVIGSVFSCQHALVLALNHTMPITGRPGPGCITTVVITLTVAVKQHIVMLQQ